MSTKNSLLLLALAIKYEGNWSSMYFDIQKKEFPSEDSEYMEQAKNYKGKYITILDDEYPEYLKSNGVRPPLVLFYEGDINILNSNRMRICVSTKRDSKNETMSFLNKMLDIDEKTDYVIASERFALDINPKHKTIYVAAGGLESVKNKYSLVLSEYPSGTPISKNTYMDRTRISAALSHKVLIGEISQYSGANLIISQALCNGEDIFVMPVSPWQEEENGLSNNKLIYEGATPVYDKETFQFDIKKQY